MKNNIIKLFRHGDVLIKTNKGFEIPKEVKLKKTNLLHKGLNHNHVIIGSAYIGSDKNGKKYMRVDKKITVNHEEHGKGEIFKGDYWIEIKSEYNHFENESREVID